MELFFLFKFDIIIHIQSKKEGVEMAYHSNNKLYRETTGGKIGGVCSGLSEYFRIDVSIIRIIFALLVLGWGSGLLLYIILWIILPDKADISGY